MVTFDETDLDPIGQIDHQAEPEFDADLSAYEQFDGEAAGHPTLHVIEWKTSVISPVFYLSAP
ncbi:MAG: hypothetical protein WCC60_20080 [Ilumatobacteraceae bacterium]